MDLPDFILASCEGYDLEKPRRCYRIRRIAGRSGDDYLLVRIDPPINGQQYGLGGNDIDQVVLATRHEGDTLFPVASWPVSVHVARLLREPAERDSLTKDDLEEIGWAEIYRTEEDARNAMK